uniref:Uncharacterized protein LOC100378044 n=1 Tax=Saccoglossus kowalevskii TaxID=10224 RepID=A0ABM0MYJ4_SACKO|nr:PREDICTED: uncharacterized protein LOC100378044 [Saccoglossus kowalevskii]
MWHVHLHSAAGVGAFQRFYITSVLARNGQFGGNFTTPLPGNVAAIENCGTMNVVSHTQAPNRSEVSLYWQIESRGIGCVEFSALVQSSHGEWFETSTSFCEFPGNEIAGCIEYRTDTVKGGQITSPNYPYQYPDGVVCVAFIHAPLFASIYLQFTSVEIEYERQCSYDSVSVYTRGTNTEPQEIICGEYIGEELRQLRFKSSSNIMVVKLTADVKFGGRGYTAKYYSLDSTNGCNLTMTADSGVVTSWNYPAFYFPNLQCHIIIHVDWSKRIRLEITELDIQNETINGECNTDVVQVFADGPERNHRSFFCGSIYKYSRKELVADSVRNIIELEFTSDYLIENSGFVAEYYTKLSCVNQTITGRNGTLSSPNYPENYPNSQDCFITIQVPEGFSVLLRFVNFQTEGTDIDDVSSCRDYVEISTGNSTSVLCGNLEGKQNQLVFQSTNNTIILHFITDGLVTMSGFYAVFDAVDIVDAALSPCPLDWLNFRDNCYEIVHTKKTWQEASGACLAEGTHLASIHSMEEQFFINSAVQNSMESEDAAFWIGGHDIIHEADYVWQDHSNFDFTDWFPGWSAFEFFGRQPTDDGLSGEDCIELRQIFHFPSKGYGVTSRLYWNDRDCHATNGYICKQLAIGASTVAPPREVNCDQFWNATNGNIRSWSFPDNYANNMDCDIVIQVTQGYQIILEFLDFVMEEGGDCQCEYDYIQIFTPGGEEEPDTVCGNQTDSIKLLRRVTDINLLIIRFHTDHSRTFEGFNAVYSVQRGPEYCDNDRWIFYNGICYLINQSKLDEVSWTVASSVCDIYNASLASITAQDQYYFLEELIRWNNGYVAGDVYWLSGSDVQSEGRWTWHDGQPFSFTAWYPGFGDDDRQYNRQPSNTSNHDCLSLTQRFETSNGALRVVDRMYWRDELCNKKAKYICQKKSLSMPQVDEQPYQLLLSGMVNFSSPNFPHKYDNNVNNVTVVQVPSGYRIKIAFLVFALEDHSECLYDFLSLKDDAQCVRLCGNKSEHLDELTFWSFTNFTEITFHTDHSIRNTGFYGYYEIVDVLSCLNRTITGRRGQLHSFNFPEKYLSNLDCRTNIRVPRGYRVYLQFEQFKLQDSADCNDDYVVIFLDGVGMRRTERYCGDHSSDISVMKFVSYQSTMSVIFHSEFNGSTGYLATFSAVKHAKVVIDVHSDLTTSGVISSLNYPNPYPINTNLTIIVRGPQDSHIIVTFEGCLMTGSAHCASKLRVYNYLLYSERREIGQIMCGDECNITTEDVLTVQSTLNTLFIEFVSHDFELEGFQARYRVTQSNDTCAEAYCSQHGRCVYKNNQYSCSCDSGFKGLFCENINIERGKTLMERLMEDPFWIGIIVILVFLLLGMSGVFLRKKIGKHLKNKRELKNIGTSSNTRANRGEAVRFRDDHSLMRVNEIILEEIVGVGIENGHAGRGQYDIEEEDEEEQIANGEHAANISPGGESIQRYLESRGTVATALSGLVSAAALSNVNARKTQQRHREESDHDNVGGTRKFISNILKRPNYSNNITLGTKSPSLRRQSYLRTGKKTLQRQNTPVNGCSIKDGYLEGTNEANHELINTSMQDRNTDGEYLNQIFVAIHDESVTDDECSSSRDTPRIYEEEFSEGISESSNELEEPDTLVCNDINQVSESLLYTIDETSKESDEYSLHQSSSVSEDSSVELPEVQPYRGRSKESLHSLHNQHVICEIDGTEYSDNVDISELNDCNSTDLSQVAMQVPRGSLFSKSFSTSLEGVSRFSDSDKETVVVNHRNGDLPHQTSQNLDDYDLEDGGYHRAPESLQSTSIVSSFDGSDDMLKNEEHGVSEQPNHLTRQRTTPSTSELDTINEGEITRHDKRRNGTIYSNKECTICEETV